MNSSPVWIAFSLACVVVGVVLVVMTGGSSGVILVAGGLLGAARGVAYFASRRRDASASRAGAQFYGRRQGLALRRFQGLVLLAVGALAVVGIGFFIAELATAPHSSGRRIGEWLAIGVALSLIVGLVQWGRR